MDEEEAELPLVAGAHIPHHQVVLTGRKGKELSSYSHSPTKKPQTQPAPRKLQQELP